ncbi:MAG: MFS transporter [Chloroflexota bacterium]|nr:MFS transporter [Chloroflexota bacterium]
MPGDKKNGLFYGYIVVGAGFVVALLTWGSYRTYGLFLQPLTAEFGWSRAETSTAYSFAFLLSGLLAAIAGRISDKFGPRLVLVVCGTLMGVGYLLMSQVSSIWQLYLFLGVIIGIGMGGMDTPILATVARWFTRRRGVITGIVKAGAGTGIFALPPLAGWLISAYGWHTAYVVIGGIVLVGTVSAALFLKGKQSEAEPEPAAVVGREAPDRKSHHLSLREAIGTGPFWIFSVIWFILVFCTQTIMLHIAPRVMDLGIPATIAATVVSTLGGVSILGRIGMGGLSDRMGTKSVLIMAQFLLAASFVWALFARQVWMFYLFATVYGFAHGAFYTLVSPMLAELFGLRSLGAILGAVTFAGTLGGALGPALAGRLFDMTGGYQVVFLINLALTVVSIIMVFFLRPIAREKRAEV